MRISFQAEPFAFVNCEQQTIPQLILVGVLRKHEHIETGVCSGQQICVWAHALNLESYLSQAANGRLGGTRGEEQ